METLIAFVGLGSIVIFIILLLIGIIGLIIKKGWAKKCLVWSLVPLLVLVVCIVVDLEDGEMDEQRTLEEKIYIEVAETKYDKDNDVIVVSTETNLPDGTEVNLHLWHEQELADYVDNPIVKDGKLNAIFGDDDGQLVVSGTYKIETIMFVNESEYNPHFYDIYGSYSEVSSLVDGTIEDYYDHYVIDFGTIGNIEVIDGYSDEESDEALKESIRKKEEQQEQELQMKKQNAKEIRFAELDKNPDKYYGEFIKYRGEIIQIMEDETSTVIRLAVTKDSYGYDFNDVVYITYPGATPFVDEDIITVYGTIMGSHTYESQAGHNISLPLIEAEIIE